MAVDLGDFVLSGDQGVIILTAVGFGEGGFGEGTFGDTVYVVVNGAEAVWVGIDTP